MARILVVGLILTGMMSRLDAKDFGVQGTTYPVIEESLLQHIKDQLSALPEATVQMKQLEVQARVKASVLNPAPVSTLRRATGYRQFIYDPTITLEKDIVDHQGRRLAAKGSVYNPLHTLQLKEALLIFDGSDPDQIAWAISQGASTKWIITKGRPFELMNRHQRPVYFDQGGAITQKFKVTSVPARLQQEGSVIRVKEGFNREEAHAH